MRRSGFTMIELIFVIVIIGILAAVAIPRLAGVQDDALISSEKTGIAAARSAVISIRGKALARGHDFNITVVDENGTSHSIKVKFSGTTNLTNNEMNLSSAKYPIQLSLDGSNHPNQENKYLTGNAMAMVLDKDGRDRYQTIADGENSQIKGPATIGVSDTSADLYNKQYWEYNVSNGIFNIVTGTTSGSF